MMDDESAIRELVDTWMVATKAGDVQTILNLMTDDVVFMVPGLEPFGKEVFKSATEEMKNVRYEGTSDIKEIKVLGNWAYMRSHLKVRTVPPEGGSPVSRSGYTLTIFRKGPDGQWRLARDANLLTVDK
ncbi:SgcJ/EcaC family oxidoreductase [Nitrososphaera viennensis]|nr:SgcJ/EcaC family oxidoreductase [Nitrososphaera viennensis]